MIFDKTNWRRIWAYPVTLLIIGILRLIIHEASHIIAALAVGGEIRIVALMPGIELYPEIKLIEWGGWGALIDYTIPHGTPLKAGFVSLSGSGFTAVVGYLVIGIMFWRRPRGLWRVAGLSMALLASWDIISYSILPEIGYRHWLFFGGQTPEPLIGAVYMGLSFTNFHIALTIHTLCANGLMLLYLFRERASDNVRKVIGNIGEEI